MPTPLHVLKAEFFKTLGHPLRVRVLEILSRGEFSVGEILAEVGIARSYPGCLINIDIVLHHEPGHVVEIRHRKDHVIALESDEILEIGYLVEFRRFDEQSWWRKCDPETKNQTRLLPSDWTPTAWLVDRRARTLITSVPIRISQELTPHIPW